MESSKITASDRLSTVSFWAWLFEQDNRKLIVVSAIAITLEFIIFKLLYPFPNFLPDSFSYIDAAFNNRGINIWPIGYSKFLRLFSVFTRSSYMLVAFQYLCLHASVLYFIFSIGYLQKLGRIVLILLLLINVLNPLLLFIGNFVSSDALFTALSLVWATQILWMINGYRGRLLYSHAIVIVLAFMIRYNALYYPLISLVFLIFAPMAFRFRLTSALLIVIFITTFTFMTRREYKEITGKVQVSAFGGWQIASNVLYAYGHVGTKERKITIPEKFKGLHTAVNKHMDSLQHRPHRVDEQLGTYYLWDENSPLMKFMRQVYATDTLSSGFKKWSSMSPLYASYAAWLIKEYPLKYVQYYVIPNMINYYIPNSEFLGLYNMGKDTIETRTSKGWFNLKTNKVYGFQKDGKIKAAEFFTLYFPIINVVFIVGLLGFIMLGGLKKCGMVYKRVVLVITFLWLCNLLFSVIASPIVLRYQVFPLVFTQSSVVVLLAFLFKEGWSIKNNAEGESTERAIGEHRSSTIQLS